MLREDLRHVDSRVGIAAPQKPEQTAVDLAAVRQLVAAEVAKQIQTAEHLRGAEGAPGPKWEHSEVHAVVEEHVANSPQLRGAQGPQGEPGRDGDNGPSVEQVRELIQKELRANAGLFRGLPGRDSTVPGPVGPKGDKGDTVVGPAGVEGKSIVGPQGEKGEKGETGSAGRDGNNPLSLDQIVQAVRATVHEVLATTPLPIARIFQELNNIDGEANLRPSLRPIYSDMTNRIRLILRDAE